MRVLYEITLEVFSFVNYRVKSTQKLDFSLTSFAGAYYLREVINEVITVSNIKILIRIVLITNGACTYCLKCIILEKTRCAGFV